MQFCPRCNFPDYYFGILGHNCANPDCRYFDNGSVRGLNLAKAPIRPLQINDPVWVDRGGGWDGKPDGFLIPGILKEFRNDDNGVPYAIIYLLQTVPAPVETSTVQQPPPNRYITAKSQAVSGPSDVMIEKGTTWAVWLDFVKLRHHLYKF